MENKLNNAVANNDEFQDISNSKVSPMEMILNNPGFVHLSENIFGNLNCEKLEVCEQINESSRQILDNALFWIRKFEGLSKKNQEDWIKVIQSEKNCDKEKFIISYLKWKLKKDAMADLSCYTNPDVQDDFRKKIRESSRKWKGEHMEIVKILAPLTDNLSSLNDVQKNFRNKIWESCKKLWGFTYHDMEIVKILAPLTDNPNALDKDGWTPIACAARNGHTEIVQILAPLTDNFNAPNPTATNKNGDTLIHWAAWNGRTEIVKILAPLTDNPNAPDGKGTTAIACAVRNGHTEIVKILVPLTDNPNAPDESGETPIHWAAWNGHTEIVKIMAPLTDNPNAPDGKGNTPINVAAYNGHTEIVKILAHQRNEQRNSTLNYYFRL